MNLAATLPYINPVYIHQPVTYIVKRLLKTKGVKISTESLYQRLREHPYFPSLLSISDVLSEIGISNQAYKIDLITLKENFESPVLIHLQIEQGLFCILDQIKDGNYRVVTEKREVKWLTEKNFIKVWAGGVILDIEYAGSRVIPDKTGDIAYPAYLKYLLLTGWAVLTFYLIQRQVASFNLERAALFILNLSGTLISWLLVLQHLNKNNVLVQQLCQSKTQEGCSSVLNNKIAMLTPWFSMAETGLIYFAGMTALTLFSDEYILLYLLSVLAPAFSVYAIYLQAFVIRKWCMLCMGVHIIVFLSFVLSFYILGQPSSILSSIREVIILSFPLLIWLIIKPHIKNVKESSHSLSNYARIKYDPEVFIALIKNQVKVNIPDNLKVFTLGNTEAEHELTFVSNPFCMPCAHAHEVIDEWLLQDLDFKINIIFLHSNANNRMHLFTEYISGVKSQHELAKVLHAWYAESGKEIENWASAHHLKPCPLLYKNEDLEQWLDTAEVHSTPTFFINGYRLPKTYQIADIRYLISEVPLKYSNADSPSLQTEHI